MKSLFTVGSKGVRATLIITLLALLGLPAVVRAQQHYYTTVTAVVKDPNGNLYANGSWQANLDLTGVPVGSLVKFQNSTSFQTAYLGQLDSAARLSVTLPDNDVIVPVGDTKWKFSFCEHYTTPTQSPAPACFDLTLLITGTSMDITSQVQAASVPLNPIKSGSVTGSLLPSIDNSWNLGSASLRWANLYATNATLGSPLGTSSGGTGTNSPALAAGAGISITGSWPNNTISATGAGANTTLSNLSNPTSINVPALDFSGAAGLTAEGSNEPITLTPSGTGNVIIGANGLQFPDATVQTTAAVGGPTVVATVNLTAQTAAIGTTTLYTPSAQGMYLLTLVPYVNSPTGTSTISVTGSSQMHSFTVPAPNMTTTNATTSQNFRFSTWGFYPDAGTAIQYSTSWTSGGSGDSCDLHMVLLQLP